MQRWIFMMQMFFRDGLIRGFGIAETTENGAPAAISHRQQNCCLIEYYNRIMSLSSSARKMVTCWCLAVASSALVFGQTVNPLGSEYAIVGALPGDQTFPDAAINANGGYLVWEDNSVTTRGVRIRGQALGADLQGANSSFMVSAMWKSVAAGDQRHPRVGLLQNGGAVIAWQGGGKPSECVYARFVRANGTFQTGDMRVSTQRKYDLSDPCVAVLADGSVVIAWSSFGQDGSMQGIFARRFSATGAALGPEFQVNQTTANNQRSPAIAALSGGGFVIAWVSELQKTIASVDIYATVFSSEGVPLTSEIPINTTTNNLCANPTVAGSSLGGFAVAWSQNQDQVLTAGNASGVIISGVPTFQSADNWDVLARIFDGAGTASTDPFRLNQYTYGDQFGPRLASTGPGYMASWTSLSQTNSLGQVDPFEGVYGQFITAAGLLGGTNDIHVNTTVFGRQLQPAVAADGAGRFLVMWSSVVPAVGRFDADVFGQIYQQSTP